MLESIEGFLTYGREQKGWTESTLHGRRYQLRRFLAWYTETFGQPPALQELNHEVCQRWVISRERENLAPSTRYAGVLALRSFGNWAVDQALLSVSPGAKLKLPRLVAITQKSCSTIEKEALMDAAQHRLPKADRTLAAAVLATFVYTGLRRFELLALNVEDIVWNDDERRAKLTVRHGKGNKPREVPINSELAPLLKAWIEIRKAPRSEPALWIGQCGKRLSDYLLGQMLGDVKIAASLEDHDNLTPHAFRHHFATELDRRGVPLPEISALLGHSSLAVTLSYLQLDREHLYDAVEILTRRPIPPPAPKLQAVKGGQQERERFAGPRRSVRLRTA